MAHALLYLQNISATPIQNISATKIQNISATPIQNIFATPLRQFSTPLLLTIATCCPLLNIFALDKFDWGAGETKVILSKLFKNNKPGKRTENLKSPVVKGGGKEAKSANWLHRN